MCILHKSAHTVCIWINNTICITVFNVIKHSVVLYSFYFCNTSYNTLTVPYLAILFRNWPKEIFSSVSLLPPFLIFLLFVCDFQVTVISHYYNFYSSYSVLHINSLYNHLSTCRIAIILDPMKWQDILSFFYTCNSTRLIQSYISNKEGNEEETLQQLR